MIERLDQPSPSTQLLESMELKNAKAKEVAHAIQELWVETVAVPQQRTRRGVHAAGPPPRIVPYEARSAIVVRATRAQMAMIRELVKKLDQPTHQRLGIHVVRLKYLRANALADTLMATLAAPTVIDPTARVVADSQSNSIIVAADGRSISGILDIVTALDVPPLQPTFK